MTPVVLSETSPLSPDSVSAADRAEMVAAAAASGCSVLSFQKSEDGDEDTAQRLLAAVSAAVAPQATSSSLPAPLPALWLGFIPGDGLYETVYEALLVRGLRLLNTPVEHARAMEFDQAYPLLGE